MKNFDECGVAEFAYLPGRDGSIYMTYYCTYFMCGLCMSHQINAIHTVYFLYVLVTYCVEYNRNPLEDTKHNRVILSRAEQALAYAG